jgi:hypothetical protein
VFPSLALQRFYDILFFIFLSPMSVRHTR